MFFNDLVLTPFTTVEAVVLFIPLAFNFPSPSVLTSSFIAKFALYTFAKLFVFISSITSFIKSTSGSFIVTFLNSLLSHT